MAESLKQIFEGHTDRINHATELLKVLGDREGQFVWKQLTAEGGDFVAFVTADAEDAYPNGGTQDGYYYVKFDPLTAIAENIREGVSIFDIIGTMSEGVSGIDYGTFVAASSVKSVTFNHNLGATPRFAALLMIEIPNSATSGVTYIISGFAISFGLTGGKVAAGIECTRNSTTLRFGANSALVSGKEFAWVAIV